MHERPYWQRAFTRLQPARALQFLLLLALLNGTLYFIVIPPWWHYDEAGHFEYAWLLANHQGWPKPGQYDEAMRLQVARSLQRFGWYRVRDATPDLSGSKPVWIGAPQTSGKPAYYFLASLPLRLMRGADITVQYYVVRLLSLLCFLLTIFIIWSALGELLPEAHPLQWLVTGFVALLPAFTDIMTGISDDVGAILVSCFFLWLSIRLVKRGFSVSRLVPWAVVLALCYLTKSTAWFALVLAPVVLLLSWLHGRLMWLPWAATPIVILLVALIALQGGGAASWYQSRAQNAPLRLQRPRAPLGHFVFQLDSSSAKQLGQTGQFLNKDIVSQLRGKTVTLGAWIWADRFIAVRPLSIRFFTDQRSHIDSVAPLIRVKQSRAYMRTVITVPTNAAYAVVLPPRVWLNAQKANLYFDGVVLTEGAYPVRTPRFSTPAGSGGQWDGRSFVNLIDNGSAEQGGLRVRPAIDEGSARWLSSIGRLSAVFSLSADWRASSWYFAASFQTLFRTFWASVAADKFNLPGSIPRNILLGMTGVGILGSFMMLWRKRKTLRWDLAYLLVAAGVLVWSTTAIRGLPTILNASPTFPWARYAFPAILPTALLICTGWAEWLNLLGWKYRLSRNALYVLAVAMVGVLSLYTLFNVEKYFHPSLAGREWLFWLGGILVVSFLLLWKRDRFRAAFRQA